MLGDLAEPNEEQTKLEKTPLWKKSSEKFREKFEDQKLPFENSKQNSSSNNKLRTWISICLTVLYMK